MLVISIVMVLAVITNTQIKSYDSEKLGHQGWFFAGNELGAILAMCFGLIVYFAFVKTTSWKKIYYWIPVGLMIYSMLQLGTKVGYAAVLIILVVALIMSLYEYWKNRKKDQNSKSNKINLSVNVIFLILFIIYTPFSPVMSNMNIHLDWVDLEEKDQTQFLDEEEQELADEKRHKAVENVIFSGRENFLVLYKEDYQDAPPIQKLFGMGYGGNNTNEGHPIEMDFHDLFFSLGIVGFLVYLFPLIYLAFFAVRAILMSLKEKFNLETALVGASIILGFGVAYTAGHTLTASAVSIYLAVLIAYLVQKVCLDEDIS
jgi:O-antigen ligase like membrane protein